VGGPGRLVGASLSATLLLAAAACSDDGGGGRTAPRRSVAAACPTGEPRPEPRPAPDDRRAVGDAGGIRFVDVTRRAGLTGRYTPACGPTECVLVARLDAETGSRVPDDQRAAWCQMERFHGGAAVGDVDGDGHPDLYVAALEGPGRLWRNRGDGTFTDVTTTSGLLAVDEPSAAAAFGDLDNDGDQDLVVSTLGGVRTWLFVNDGTGRFREEGRTRGFAPQPGVRLAGYSVALGDVDRDGWLDVFVTEYGGGVEGNPLPLPATSRLYRNRGSAAPGHFVDATADAGLAGARGRFGFAATLRDLDRDGWVDLALTADFGTSRMFWNTGAGTFTDGTETSGAGTDDNGMGATTGDLDGDGVEERFVSSIADGRGSSLTRGGNWTGSGNRLWRVEGRTFTDVTDRWAVRDGRWGWGAAFLDTRNSGRLDLVQASGIDFPYPEVVDPLAPGPTFLWRNDGDAYTEVGAAAGLTVRNGRGVVVFDADGDGRLDLLVVRPGGRPSLWRNESRAGAWLRVRAVGRGSNRDGIGALVTVVPRPGAPGRTVEVQSVTDFAGQSERIAHVGLGAQRGPLARVEVRFGGRDEPVVRTGVPPNRLLVVTEPGDGSPR
jgi:hypothetical protein